MDGWDVAVVDLFLREDSGPNVIAWCSARKPNQRVVIFSNYATDDVRRSALWLGADAVFETSTELDGLLDFLESLPPST